jgi:hypothetical protein
MKNCKIVKKNILLMKKNFKFAKINEFKNQYISIFMKNSITKILYLFITVLFFNSCIKDVKNENKLKSKNNDTLGHEINYNNKEVINKDENIPELKVQEKKFEVPVGKSINKFKYTNEGELLYNEKSFTPKIITFVNSVELYKISTSKVNNNAGAIGMDIDGQNLCYFLDLDNMTSTSLTENTYYFQEMYWSPSSKYLITFCTYEGQSLCISINSKSKKITIKNLKQDNDFNTFWEVDNKPEWEKEKDILQFRVAEYYNPFSSNYNNEDLGKVLGKYNVKLDAKTLNINVINKIF